MQKVGPRSKLRFPALYLQQLTIPHVKHGVFGGGGSRTFGVIGFQGMPPYLFEIDAAAFVGGDGEIAARFEAEYEMVLTQRWILQPRFEANLAISAAKESAGGAEVDAGIKIRYEIVREFAPDIGVAWVREAPKISEVRLGEERRGDSGFALVAGVRFWR